MSPAPAGRSRYLATSPFNASRAAEITEILPIAVGQSVSHDRHGLGRAVSLEGEKAVIIDFSGRGLVRVALDSPRLHRL